MELHITLQQRNSDYDQDYPDQYNFGKEGDSNWKLNWANGYKIPLDGYNEIKLKKSEQYPLRYEKEDGSKGMHLLDNMAVLELIDAKGPTTCFVISNRLLTNVRTYTQRNRTYYYFDFNEVEFFNPLPHIYITPDDLPAN